MLTNKQPYSPLSTPAINIIRIWKQLLKAVNDRQERQLPPREEINKKTVVVLTVSDGDAFDETCWLIGPTAAAESN